MATTSKEQSGKASTLKKIFSRQTTVNIEIKAHPSIIWSLLTTASDFSRWNNTVLSIDGDIAEGKTIKLIAALSPNRVFKLKVKVFEPCKKLAWGDAMGTRVFTITERKKNCVIFSMTEKIGGPLFPLFAGMIPPFDNAFEQFAMNLKKEAEYIMNTK